MSERPPLPEGESLDSLFRALAHPRRRGLLRLLSDLDEPSTIPGLAEMIARDEQDAEPDVIDDDDIDSIYTELYHWHIPVLEDCELVNCEGSRGPVTLSEWAASVSPIIEFAEERR